MKFEHKTLGELYEIASGLSKEKSFFGHGYPFLSFKTVFDNCFLPDELLDLVNTTEKERIACSIKYGDVFLTRTSENTDELGMSSVALKEYPNATFNGFTKRLRPKKNAPIDPKFAGFWFRSVYFRELVKSMSVMTTRASLNNEMIQRLTIPLPPIDIQRAIANILYCFDSKITNNIKINNRLEQMAQAIFKSWFVDFEPWDGEMPDDWKIVPLGEVTTPIRKGVGNRTLSVLSAVATGNLVLSDEYFTKRVYSKDIGKYIVVEPNDFSYNPARVNIGSIGMNDFEFAGCVSPVYVVFRTEPEYHHFLNFVIKTPSFQEEVRTRASGSVRQSMNYSDFALIKSVYPVLSIVRDFNHRYEKIIEAIKQNEAENKKLAAIRDTLLPRLMSSEIKIPLEV